MNKLQDLLDAEAKLSNTGLGHSEERQQIHTVIRLTRNERYRPGCFGEDDCSTTTLSTCPWRIDCG